MKNKLFAIIAISFCLNVHGQKWVEMMSDTNANFYDIVKEFDNYWKDREVEKGKGYKAFKRWQWFIEPRVYPSGNMKYASRTYALEQHNAFYKGKGKFGQNNTNAVTANWTPLGPFGSPSGGEAGRVQVITLHPNNTNIFYVGSAAGGFWMTNNGGSTYTTTTDQLGSCGVSDIAVDPFNTNSIYISTGDKDAGDTHSTGVMKSTDGGQTWNVTGLQWSVSQQRRIYRLLINPLNPNTLIAASSVGVYRTLDAGVTWSLVLNGSFVDAEYRPGDTSTVYVVTNGSFAKSTNGGSSFTYVGISNSLTSNRLSLAVTPANNNYVYLLASDNSNGFGGLYRSTNSGGSFSLRSSAPNIFDWSTNGSGGGGQGWYDIAIDASPVNAEEIVAGGVNSWRSTNGGTNWSLYTHWTGSGGRPYVHADLHCVRFASGTTCFLGTDGGVARTTNGGVSWSSINGNMNIAQMYKIGLSASTASRIIAGHQDNGSNLLNGVGWSSVMGGDGMDCFIDWNNNNVMVASTQNGGFRRSTNGGVNWSGITNGLGGIAPWVSPIVQDPISPNTYYCGYSNVYKSTNQGSSWTLLGNINTGIDEIKVSPSNNSIIYATSSGGVWKTTNGGAVWSNITGTISGVGQITDLAIDNTNPNNIFVTQSGYNAGNKVFASHDGGISWSNYSNGLPNIPVNCIVYKNNSAQALYIGTDVGVYYREASMNSWIPYSTGLPNIVVNDLEIYYPTGKLRAGTYARGVWETNLYSDPAAAPVGAFNSFYSPGCINTPLQLYDLSANTPTAWIWSFPGGNPSTATIQNPLITYTATGIYSVTLVSSNNNGLSTPYTSTIQIVSSPTVNSVSASVCVGQQGNLVVNTNATSVFWSTGQQGFSAIVNSQVNNIYTYTATIGACATIGTATLFVDPLPATPIIILMPGYLTTTVTANTYQWYKSGTMIPGATSQTFAPQQDGFYSVWAGIGNCFSSSSYYNFITEGIGFLTENSSEIAIRPNPVKDELTVVSSIDLLDNSEYIIQNSIGQIVTQSKLKVENNEAKIVTQQLAPGIYLLNINKEGKPFVLKFIKQ